MKTISISRHARLLFIPVLAVLLSLGGCASPVSSGAMVPTAFKVQKQQPATVSVAVAGGSETSAMGKSQIADAELVAAVTQAINTSHTFTRVVAGKDGDYLLTVNIFNLTQPSFGFSFTVQMEMGWTLSRAGSVVWKKSIKSEGTAGAGDAFAGTTRLRMATEAAARNNIASGLEQISALSL